MEGSGIYEASYQGFLSGKQMKAGIPARRLHVLVPRRVAKPLDLSVPICKMGDFGHCHLQLVGMVELDEVCETLVGAHVWKAHCCHTVVVVIAALG